MKKLYRVSLQNKIKMEKATYYVIGNSKEYAENHINNLLKDKDYKITKIAELATSMSEILFIGEKRKIPYW